AHAEKGSAAEPAANRAGAGVASERPSQPDREPEGIAAGRIRKRAQGQRTMTRFLGLIFLFFILGGLIALGFNAGSGFVLLRYGHDELQTSLIFCVIALIIIAIIIYLFLRLLVTGWRLPIRFGDWRRKKRHGRARNSLMSGLMALYEGRWNEAENQLMRHAGQSE